MSRQPIAELFGFPPESGMDDAKRYRRSRLCPYNNKVPNCTKDSVTNPLGVCSIFHGNRLAVICPVRLRQDWMIAEHAADFFFPPGTRWTTLIDVELPDENGKSIGKGNLVLVAYDERGYITDFGLLELRSGNQTDAIPSNGSSTTPLRSREGIAPYHFGSSIGAHWLMQTRVACDVNKIWSRKIAIATDEYYFDSLPPPIEVPKVQAQIAWLICSLGASPDDPSALHLAHRRTVYARRTNGSRRTELSHGISEPEFLSQIEYEIETTAV